MWTHPSVRSNTFHSAICQRKPRGTPGILSSATDNAVVQVCSKRNKITFWYKQQCPHNNSLTLSQSIYSMARFLSSPCCLFVECLWVLVGQDKTFKDVKLIIIWLVLLYMVILKCVQVICFILTFLQCLLYQVRSTLRAHYVSQLSRSRGHNGGMSAEQGFRNFKQESAGYFRAVLVANEPGQHIIFS